jgi:hypothetical protein
VLHIQPETIDLAGEAMFATTEFGEWLLELFVRPLEDILTRQLGVVGFGEGTSLAIAFVLVLGVTKLAWHLLERYSLPEPTVWHKLNVDDADLMNGMFSKAKVVAGVADKLKEAPAKTLQEFCEQVRRLQQRFPE